MAMKQEPKKDRAKVWHSDSTETSEGKGTSETEERIKMFVRSDRLDEEIAELRKGEKRPIISDNRPASAPIRPHKQIPAERKEMNMQYGPLVPEPARWVWPEVQEESEEEKAQATAEAEVEALVAKAQAAAEAEVQPKMESGLISFLGGVISGAVTAIDESLELIVDPVKRLVSGSLEGLIPALLGAALSPFLWPLAAGLLTLGVGQALCLREDTLEKLVQPLQEEPTSEDTLRRVIEDVLSQDRQANEDLAQFFKRIAPLIQKAEATTHVHISGPVHGLIVGDQNTVTQKFESSFLERS